VAQGTFYYYFKSKEEILDALIGRQISKLTSKFEAVAYSDSITPPRKVELVLSIVFDTIHYKDGLLFDYLHNDRYLHLMDKMARQGKSFVAPHLMKIIEEGERLQYFNVSHVNVALKFIMAIIDCTIDSIYEKSPAEELRCQFEMAEILIQKALGVPEGTLHFELDS
jgi:AcrR family transcriptional regulator